MAVQSRFRNRHPFSIRSLRGRIDRGPREEDRNSDEAQGLAAYCLNPLRRMQTALSDIPHFNAADGFMNNAV